MMFETIEARLLTPVPRRQAFAMVMTRVDRDAIEPGREPRSAPERIQPPVRFEETVLCQFLGEPRVPHHADHEPINRILVSPHQTAKSLGVALLRPTEKIGLLSGVQTARIAQLHPMRALLRRLVREGGQVPEPPVLFTRFDDARSPELHENPTIQERFPSCNRS